MNSINSHITVTVYVGKYAKYGQKLLAAELLSLLDNDSGTHQKPMSIVK